MAVKLLALRTGCHIPSGIFLVLISVRGWIDPRAIVCLEGLDQLKNSMTSLGFEPVTFQCVKTWNKSTLPQLVIWKTRAILHSYTWKIPSLSQCFYITDSKLQVTFLWWVMQMFHSVLSLSVQGEGSVLNVSSNSWGKHCRLSRWYPAAMSAAVRRLRL
jgi:hypothetical protein